jgi:predicted Zn-dependent protease
VTDRPGAVPPESLPAVPESHLPAALESRLPAGLENRLPAALENRLPAEGINSSAEHPLREAAWLVGATLATLAAAVVLVGWGAQWLAPRLPFSTEVAIAQQVVDPAAAQPPAHAAASQALQALADRVAAQMDLPPGMVPVLRFEDAPVVNAYATVGGRIRVYRGLLERLRSEQELAALLAHEMAHVKHRHVAANLGRGLAVALLLSLVSADAGAAAAQGTLGQAAGLALLSYSREQETQADTTALLAVTAVYGHGAGLVDLFRRLADADTGIAGDAGLEMLRTHPLTHQRSQAIEALAHEQGWPLAGPTTPLPAELVFSRPAPQ